MINFERTPVDFNIEEIHNVQNEIILSYIYTVCMMF